MNPLLENQEVQNDLRDFLLRVVQYREQALRHMSRLSLNITLPEKIGARYRIEGINLTDRIWRSLSADLEGAIKIQEIEENLIYKQFLILKEQHEEIFHREIPLAWYDEAFRQIASQDADLRQKIFNCIQEYAKLAAEFETRCNEIQYPHGQNGLTDGRDFIKHALAMDIHTFLNILEMRREMEQ